MKKILGLGCLPFALGLCAAGCVRLSKYRALQTQENQAVLNLQAAQTQNAALKQENDKLSTDLEAARRQLVDLAVDLKADLAQAQDSIATALKRLDAITDSDASASPATPASPASTSPAPIAASTAAATISKVPQKK